MTVLKKGGNGFPAKVTRLWQWIAHCPDLDLRDGDGSAEESEVHEETAHSLELDLRVGDGCAEESEVHEGTAHCPDLIRHAHPP